MKCPSVAFIATYLPKQCGIATFTHDLASATSHAMGISLADNHKIQIAAMHSPMDTFRYGQEVGFTVRQQQRRDYKEAAEYLNISPVDVVCLQHEYGIFGGDDGKYILDLLENLRKPVVTTLHTVLSQPSPGQRETLGRICEIASYVVVIADRAREMLTDIYGVPPEKIVHIYHGVPDVPYLDPAYYKDQFQLEGKKVLLTFGLIGPNKGIEYAIDAIAPLVADFPNLVYVVLGATHPEVKRHTGEEYRLGLQQRARERGVADNVVFYDRFVSDEQLMEFLLMADFYITPYLAKEQISSGTLSFALGCGKAIVSTPYWYAQEILAEGRGLLAPFGDSGAMGAQLRRLLSDEVEYNQIRKRAYQFGRTMVWKEVGRKYCDTFRKAAEGGVVKVAMEKRPIHTTLPEVGLDHLHRMTDDTGFLQHAIFATPWRQHGYTTDDNARALRFVIRYRNLFQDDSVIPLAQTYLAFLLHAFDDKTNRFHNFLSYDRRWLDDVGSEDCQGRSMAALADTLVDASNEALAGIAKELFDFALRSLKEFTAPRAWAWVLMACDRYLKRFGGAREVRDIRDEMAQRLLKAFEKNASAEWCWCEDALTYDNARLCKAIIVAAQVTDHGEKLPVALGSLDWLLRVQTNPSTGFLSLVGNMGWMKRGGEKALFDQQPLEAGAMLSACHEAYKATKDERWKVEMRRCYEWFLGANDLNATLYDFKTHGCHDGLQAHGVNENQGAESTLSWLGALLRMHEVGL